MSITIGSLTLGSPVILAPMSGITDRPFRRLVRSFGVGLVVSEMIASQAMIRATRLSMRKGAAGRTDEHPLSVQLAGCDPAVMAEAARMNEDLGAAIIDINFGCPVKKVVGKLAGSALMRDLREAARIIEAVAHAVRIPVTLKMRTGWDADHRNAPELARIAEASGVSMLAVHGRTRDQLYRGRADWRFIREVKAAVTIPVVANGDIATVEGAERCLALSGANGVMVGRGAYGRPWFPSQVATYLRNGAKAPDPSPEMRLATALEHYDGILTEYGTEKGVRIARKHLAWYCADMPGAAQTRASLFQLEDPAQVRSTLRGFFNTFAEAA
jgi:tRNA-dihydrouridine synthase B